MTQSQERNQADTACCWFWCWIGIRQSGPTRRSGSCPDPDVDQRSSRRQRSGSTCVNQSGAGCRSGSVVLNPDQGINEVKQRHMKVMKGDGFWRSGLRTTGTSNKPATVSSSPDQERSVITCLLLDGAPARVTVQVLHQSGAEGHMTNVVQQDVDDWPRPPTDTWD